MSWALLFSNDIMYIILAFIVIMITIWLYNLNKDPKNKITFIDLIATNGRIEERKLTRFGAWIVSTWGLVYLISAGKLQEWYFIGYMGAWVANALIGHYLVGKDQTEKYKFQRGYYDAPQYYQNDYNVYENTQIEGNHEYDNEINKQSTRRRRGN